MGELKNLKFDGDGATTETTVSFTVEYKDKTYFGTVHAISTEPTSEQEDYEYIEITRMYKNIDGVRQAVLPDGDAEDLKYGEAEEEIIQEFEKRW